VIYVRASLDKTGERASVARQEEACRALALARGWGVVEIKSDNSISASTGKVRPAWEDVLSMIAAGEVDVVIAWHMDRITRSMLVLERLITLAVEQNVGIATATGDVDLTTDAGRMVARILAAVARGEVERKAARQVLAYQQKARSGRPNWSSRPFGFEKDGSLHQIEAEALADVYRDVLNGSTLAAVARRLNEAGLFTNRGAEWSGYTLRPVLTNPRNIGKVTYKGEIVAEMDCDPIVAADTFYAVNHLLSDPSRNTGGGGVVQTLLSGIAQCRTCDGTVKLMWSGLKGEVGSFPRYTCHAGHTNIPMEFVDGVVFMRLMDAAEGWAGALMPQADPEKVTALLDEQRALTVRLEEIGFEFANPSIPKATILAATTRVEARLVEIEDELGLLGGTGGGYPIGPNWEFIAQEFDAMPLDRQRGLIAQVFAKIVLIPPGRGVRATKDHIVTIRHGEEDTEVPTSIGRTDPYVALAEVLVDHQPSVTKLREAGEWLRAEGHTRYAVSGLMGRLSPLVKYDAEAGAWEIKA
jgi:DNA invertase Pin-like site-specific DNA recombinase